jgi:chromate transport protein ChrA
LRGSLAALAGILVFPVVLSVMLTALFLNDAHIEKVQHAMGAVAAAAAGLVIGAAFASRPPLSRKRATSRSRSARRGGAIRNH